MAIQEEVSYTGQNNLGTLNSTVRIEEGKGRIVISDGVDEKVVGDRDGFTVNKGNISVQYGGDGMILKNGTLTMLLLGIRPDNVPDLIIAKPGYDIYNIVTP